MKQASLRRTVVRQSSACALQGVKGRYISGRHQVIFATRHGSHLVAIVCPDPATTQAQGAATLRVYTLDLGTLRWELLANAPGQNDPATCQLHAPLPRFGAACCHKGDQVMILPAHFAALVQRTPQMVQTLCNLTYISSLELACQPSSTLP